VQWTPLPTLKRQILLHPCRHNNFNQGAIRALFLYFSFFLFHGRGRGDRFRHQGYPAPPSLVSVLYASGCPQNLHRVPLFGLSMNPSADPLMPYTDLSSQGNPMRLKQVTTTSTEVELADGTCVLFSYQTPVAALVPGKGWIRTATKWSVTTSKHINRWLAENCGGEVATVPQWELDQLVAF